jgi:uncharacterized membrane protein YqjE
MEGYEGTTAFFFVLGVILVGWTLYMATFRTEDYLRLAKDEEERRKARHERAGKMLGGAVKTGFTVAKMLKK